MLIFDLIMFLAACLVLIKSGSILVKSVTKIAIFLRLSDFVIAFILVAFTTSLPELFVGITSAIKNAPVLSLGNIIGANIVDVALVMGIASILARNIKVSYSIARRDSIYIFLIALVPLFLASDYALSRRDGIVLLVVFGFYLRKLLRTRLAKKSMLNSVTPFEFLKSSWMFALGAVLLLASAYFTVKYATLLAFELEIPLILIGLSIVAIGTTLPELVFESKAVMTGRKELAVGDMYGSIVINSTLILGLVSIIRPIVVINHAIFLLAIAFLIITLAIFTVLINTRYGISWKTGVLLIIMYIIFIITEFYMKRNMGGIMYAG